MKKTKNLGLFTNLKQDPGAEVAQEKHKSYKVLWTRIPTHRKRGAIAPPPSAPPPLPHQHYYYVPSPPLLHLLSPPPPHFRCRRTKRSILFFFFFKREEEKKHERGGGGNPSVGRFFESYTTARLPPVLWKQPRIEEPPARSGSLKRLPESTNCQASSGSLRKIRRTKEPPVIFGSHIYDPVNKCQELEENILNMGPPGNRRFSIFGRLASSYIYIIQVLNKLSKKYIGIFWGPHRLSISKKFKALDTVIKKIG